MQLVRYDAARAALAECRSVDEVKGWADKAAALQAYGRMAQDKGLEVDAAEIRIRAERRLGELIGAQKAAGGLKPAATLKRGPVVVADDHGKRATLADAGISKDLSSRAQKLAAVPAPEFEREVGAWRGRVKAEGARVSARLEAAGERAQRERTTADDAHDGFDPLAELELAQKEIERLTAELKAAEADDLKAEALKWRRAYDHAVREQSAAMDRASKMQDREAWTMRQLRRCGKAIGQDDPDKIAPAVEAFARAHREPAQKNGAHHPRANGAA